MAKFLTQPHSTPKTPLPHLPPEIWAKILECVLDPVCCPYENNTSQHLPSLLDTLSRFAKTRLDFEDWSRIRLVCRMFCNLVGPRPYVETDRVDAPIPDGVKCISIFVARDMLHFTGRISAQPHKFRRLKTLALTIMNLPNDPLEALLGNAMHLQSMRSLSFLTIFPVLEYPPRFWSRLHEAFPSLVALAVWMKGATYEEDVSFKFVTELFIPNLPTAMEVRFPALKYVSTHHWDPQGTFEKVHGPLIESLILHGKFQEQRDIISFLPKLQLLGLPVDELTAIRPPYPSHPIFHFCALLGPDRPFKKEMATLKEILIRMPRIRKLSLSFQDPMTGADKRLCIEMCKSTSVTMVGMPLLQQSAFKSSLQVAGRLLNFN